MKEKSEIVNYLLNVEEPYILEVNNIQVEMIYKDNNKKFEDCMLNILEQRIKKI